MPIDPYKRYSKLVTVVLGTDLGEDGFYQCHVKMMDQCTETRYRPCDSDSVMGDIQPPENGGWVCTKMVFFDWDVPPSFEMIKFHRLSYGLGRLYYAVIVVDRIIE